ncbi:hypothetical protein Tco_0954424 [Tanacetum coccineum]|uniref:Uncharacterized protein n=1 Tax=Tanacetum coccineum TaxID=301880 RepID=A0ABQ5E3B7_9ASTR
MHRWHDTICGGSILMHPRNGGEGNGNDKRAITKGRNFDSTTNCAASASGSVWMHPRSAAFSFPAAGVKREARK